MKSERVIGLDTLPPVIERYELKYVIPLALIEPISDYLSTYCSLDRHSTKEPDGFYPVNSLYFDSPNFRFLKLRLWGIDHRFNMRMRAYGDGQDGPYFAEIKHKTPTSVKKFRATIQANEWPGFLHSGAQWEPLSAQEDREKISRHLFLRLAESYAIEPKIFTCYRRRAFISDFDDYARVTFDIDMRYRAQDPVTSSTPYCLNSDRGCVNYDSQGIYGDELRYNENVVLELKTTAGCIPIWMMDLIRRFELKRVGFSKYLNSTLVGQEDRGWHYMANDRTGGVAA